MSDFREWKVSKKVKVTCGPCLKGKHNQCTPLTPIKKVTCQCAFLGHMDRGFKGKKE